MRWVFENMDIYGAEDFMCDVPGAYPLCQLL